jgi:hypothetical protein
MMQRFVVDTFIPEQGRWVVNAAPGGGISYADEAKAQQFADRLRGYYRGTQFGNREFRVRAVESPAQIWA